MRLLHKADNRMTFMCRLSRNLGASTSWNPQCLVIPVTGINLSFKSSKIFLKLF